MTRTGAWAWGAGQCVRSDVAMAYRQYFENSAIKITARVGGTLLSGGDAARPAPPTTLAQLPGPKLNIRPGPLNAGCSPMPSQLNRGEISGLQDSIPPQPLRDTRPIILTSSSQRTGSRPFRILHHFAFCTQLASKIAVYRLRRSQSVGVGKELTSVVCASWQCSNMTRQFRAGRGVFCGTGQNEKYYPAVLHSHHSGKTPLPCSPFLSIMGVVVVQQD